jgi:hypothetical protein
LAVAGLCLFAIGFSFHLGRVVFGSLPEYGTLAREWESNVGAYLADGDAGHLEGGEIPYVSSERLIEYLEQPECRAILPSSVRRDGRSGPLSVIAARAASLGWVFAAAGLAVWLLLLGDGLRKRRSDGKEIAGSLG